MIQKRASPKPLQWLGAIPSPRHEHHMGFGCGHKMVESKCDCPAKAYDDEGNPIDYHSGLVICTNVDLPCGRCLHLQALEQRRDIEQETRRDIEAHIERMMRATRRNGLDFGQTDRIEQHVALMLSALRGGQYAQYNVLALHPLSPVEWLWPEQA